MSALRIVHLLPRANVPAQRMRQTNVFAAVRSDKTAMRPFVKLLWTLAGDSVLKFFQAVPDLLGWLHGTVVERRLRPANFPCPALDL